MLNLAVIGKDVSKSLSPRMHRFILDGMGERCSYDAVSIPPQEFSVRAEALFERYDAFNVTIPFKADIIPYLKELRGDALVLGAVNTVLARERAGYNTDGYGFMLMLENAGIEVAGKTALVLGAGGAGRSCVKKLADAGAEVFAYGRNFGSVRAVYDDLHCFTPLAEVPLRSFDLVVNCTGVGMHATSGQSPAVAFGDGQTSPVGERFLSLCGTAVDLIYEPAQSEFLRIADLLGKKTVNGEAMLFYQAYMADCIYLNRIPSAEEAKGLFTAYKEETL